MTSVCLIIYSNYKDCADKDLLQKATWRNIDKPRAFKSKLFEHIYCEYQQLWKHKFHGETLYLFQGNSKF